jgi:hypothetical protein
MWPAPCSSCSALLQAPPLRQPARNDNVNSEAKNLSGVQLLLTSMNYQHIKQRLDAKDIIVLDGGTGTELQRRGAKMDTAAWCCPHSRSPFF